MSTYHAHNQHHQGDDTSFTIYKARTPLYTIDQQAAFLFWRLFFDIKVMQHDFGWRHRTMDGRGDLLWKRDEKQNRWGMILKKEKEVLDMKGAGYI